MQAIAFTVCADSLSLNRAHSSKDSFYSSLFVQSSQSVQQENKLKENTQMPHPENLLTVMKNRDTDGPKVLLNP